MLALCKFVSWRWFRNNGFHSQCIGKRSWNLETALVEEWVFEGQEEREGRREGEAERSSASCRLAGALLVPMGESWGRREGAGRDFHQPTLSPSW